MAGSTPQVRLPAIKLPSFSGKYEDWISFSDSFQALIHHNESLSDIQKLHYLKSSLTDDAAKVLKALELSSANYSVAWKLLEDRYKNTRRIVQGHVKALFDLPVVDRESASTLRQLLDGTLTHMRALQALEQPVDKWDTLVVHLVTTKIGPTTYQQWEMSTEPDILPSLKQLTDFLLRRCQILETSAKYKPFNTQSAARSGHNRMATKQTFLLSKDNNTCRYCKENHLIYHCHKLLHSSDDQRAQVLKRAGLCFNCLRPGHTVTHCKSGGCKKCGRKHNTLLHPTEVESVKPDNKSSQLNPSKDIVQSCHVASRNNVSTHVVLSTAIVDVIGPRGHFMQCRALIDNGSQSSFITERIAQQLGLSKQSQTVTITGIDQTRINSHGTVQATIKSRVSNYTTNLQLLVVPKITGQLPTDTIQIEHLKIPKHISLADPTFATPGRIDLLIGQEIFLDLLCIGQIRSKNMPTFQKTRLGWIVGGKCELAGNTGASICHLSTIEERVDRQLQAFWQLEEPTSRVYLTAEETTCEDHFKAHTKRDHTGRYIVKMPLRENPITLGESRETAVRRLEQVEKRLARNEELKGQYTEFMNEYIQLGHMEEVKEVQQTCSSAPEYFLPHHPVIKESSSTTKLRVVFDASSKTSSGKSLNDIQVVGPIVQSDLFSIILRFRLFTHVMTADLEKMYRQITIDPSQRSLLQIVWRDDPTIPIKVFRLNTVTYGTASAPYLATRTLNQLATDEGVNFQEAAQVVRRDFYMDDVLTGTNSIEEGMKLQSQLIELLAKAHFNLRKWNSNSEELLKHLPEHLLERQPQEFATDVTAKTLGLWWDAERDQFLFRYAATDRKKRHLITKRVVLSEVARLFDPLGLAAPIIVRAKMLLQELWKMKVGWDEALPMHIHTQWNNLVNCFYQLNHLRIFRQVTLPSSRVGQIEVHGFSDASEQAYGAAVYLRHVDLEGNTKCRLLCSKSRVAPLHTTSLPRLELCAAVLLSELVCHVEKALPISPSRTMFWSDSTVVLAWINAEPARWTTFVANRVAKIQNISSHGSWNHVRTEQNPADLVSRGVRAQELNDCYLWWNGPKWLSTGEDHWPLSRDPISHEIPERRIAKTTSFVTTTKQSEENDTLKNLVEDFSSYKKITRVVAYCLRFAYNLKQVKETRLRGPLTTAESQAADTRIIKWVQEECFGRELKNLSTGQATSTQMSSLAPFLDKAGLIRVGGRLDHSDLSYEGKHPLLLPKGHPVTEMIAREEHVRQLHCGPQALLYTIRQNYWPINGRELTRRIVHKCITCFRAKPRHGEQLMGDLPTDRTRPSRPFLHTGVDYCGPFQIKQSRRRNAPMSKSYVAVFVCLATKAIHIELVSNLTTESFLGALRRFTSRRGMCSEILSDNGQTFVGADRELKNLHEFLKSEGPAIVTAAMSKGINWKFIPPYAPHMGGLWEAAVKSLKHDLKRIVGNASLTFEEMSTTLTQVEAVLNSRPLTPMSNDPNDLTVLTPSHFLTGGSLTALSDPSLILLPENRLSRWQRVQQLLQYFWVRWSKEYLNNLQQRGKWKVRKTAVQVGSLVIIKDDHLPALSWPMGRVLSLHPGRDNIVRVVTLKTSAGEVKRNVTKVCPLPIEA